MFTSGANDGMLHAFNAGFYDTVHNKFWKGYDPVATTYSDTGLDLGAELWAYVPYNLLPHLYWLTERTYNRDVHISYVDLKPRIFDAKIFPADTAHPGGWGTVLVGGMRFGGGKVRADLNKADGMAYNPDVDRTMTSAYFILDITNPESPPTLLGEITSDTLGFTTCYPAVMVLKDKDPSATENQWYLFLGSGPISANGADSIALANATSSQPAQIVLVDLKKLATDHQIWSLDSSGNLAAGINPFASLDANAFVSDPVAVDFNLDYKTDVVYFGTISGDFASGWGGKLRRLVVDNDTDPHLTGTRQRQHPDRFDRGAQRSADCGGALCGAGQRRESLGVFWHRPLLSIVRTPPMPGLPTSKATMALKSLLLRISLVRKSSAMPVWRP